MSLLLLPPSIIIIVTPKSKRARASKHARTMLLRNRIFSTFQIAPLLSPSHPRFPPFTLCFRNTLSHSIHTNPSLKPNINPIPNPNPRSPASATPNTSVPPTSDDPAFDRSALFVPPGVDLLDVSEEMVLPGSNIVLGPYAGDLQIRAVEFVKSSARAKDCPKDQRPEFAILGRSNVGKSSLINALVRKKDMALTSKKPGKTQLINHFLVNKSWYLVDLPGYGYAVAAQSARMDWSSFTKGYFLNRTTLVGVLLLIDASAPPQKIDLDCANWLGRNEIPMTLVFTKCDKTRGGKGKGRPDENIGDLLQIMKENYRKLPPWIMTSSVTGLGRQELLRHMSQLKNYWDD